jgi:predicted TIM-barrel fold metal-dependent hydrolase
VIVDLWANVVPPEQAARWTGQQANAGIEGLLGSDFGSAGDSGALLAVMDEVGVDVAVLVAGLDQRGDRSVERLLQMADENPGRFLVAGAVDRPDRVMRQLARLRDVAEHPAFRLVRVTPLSTQVAINAAQHYPIYAACCELALPVSVNVGIPGPRVRSACQHPELLEDVLIDFPDLVVIGAHMGHPYEALLMDYMLKWPNLYLSTTAYLPKYLDPALLAFMDSRRGLGRVIWGSDHPFLPMGRSLEAARALPMSDAARDAFLGGTAARLLERSA